MQTLTNIYTMLLRHHKHKTQPAIFKILKTLQVTVMIVSLGKEAIWNVLTKWVVVQEYRMMMIQTLLCEGAIVQFSQTVQIIEMLGTQTQSRDK